MSFFNQKKEKTSKIESKTGLIIEDPILMDSIKSSYGYLDCLCTISIGLSYKRIGSIECSVFEKVVDKYVFMLNGSSFCELFVYAYYDENVNIIPFPFIELNSSISDDIFENNIKNEVEDNPTKEISWLCCFTICVDFILLKNDKFVDKDVHWSTEKEMTLTKFLSNLGYEDVLEQLILDEVKEVEKHSVSVDKKDFIEQFICEFHHQKLSKYIPKFIQERNEKIKSAFFSIVNTIDKIQKWLDNDLLRKRIEISIDNNSELNLGVSTINKSITPFCVIILSCDIYGRFNIIYEIDSRITSMLPSNFENTLLRRIYEFTPGELEPFVCFTSLNMDCITNFENNLKEVNKPNCMLIEVDRNSEQSVSDLLKNIELKEGLDDETIKWLKR
jgi:hypothetical protein